MRSRLSALNAGVDRWLTHVVFGGMEVCSLSIPAMLALLSAPRVAAVSLSALTTLGVASATVGTLRGGYVRTGEWPGATSVRTMPIRSAYFSATLGAGTWAGVQAQLLTSLWWLGVLVPLSVTVLALVSFPRVLRGLQGLARHEGPIAVP